jgi:hypothetical protein
MPILAPKHPIKVPTNPRHNPTKSEHTPIQLGRQNIIYFTSFRYNFNISGGGGHR